jgi:hypothetical protein
MLHSEQLRYGEVHTIPDGAACPAWHGSFRVGLCATPTLIAIATVAGLGFALYLTHIEKDVLMA